MGVEQSDLAEHVGLEGEQGSEHVVRAELTTDGATQSTQSAPKAEKFAPVQARCALSWLGGGRGGA